MDDGLLVAGKQAERHTFDRDMNSGHLSPLAVGSTDGAIGVLHAPERGEAHAGFHEEPSLSRHNGGYRRARRALEGAVREARKDALVPGRQHRRGLHRVRLHARRGER